MLKITPAQKLKVSVAVIWVCLLTIQALWGERYLEPTGVAVDSKSNIYISMNDSYRAEACLQKFSSSGKRLWYRVYQSNRVSGAETQNMVRITPDAIYQMFNEYGKNSSYLTILKYASNGRRIWAKEMSHQPYFKDFALRGDDLEILAMDRDYASLVLTGVKSGGDLIDPILVFNPFDKQRTWFRKITDGLFLVTQQDQQSKVIMIKPDGQVIDSFTITATGRVLGLDRMDSLYMINSNDAAQVVKYSDTGKLVWQSRLKQRWDQNIKEDLRSDYIEVTAGKSTYLAGKAQLFIAKSNYKTLYDRNAVRYFEGKKYWRQRGGDRVFIAKFSPNGVLAWTRYLVTNQHYPKVAAMASDRNENIYITGNFTLLDAKQNLFLAKYNRDGKLVWIKRKYQIPGSLFYIGLIGAFLIISLYKKERVWILELVVLIGLILLFWGETLVW